VKIDDIFPMQNPEQSSVYRFNILLSMVCSVKFFEHKHVIYDIMNDVTKNI